MERDTLRTLCRSADDFRLLKRELKGCFRRAEEGDLGYGKTSDVFRSQSADLVLEMRFRQRLQLPRGSRVIRLYFSEPAHMPQMLLAAHLAGKPSSDHGLELQTEQMGEAQLRILKFLGVRSDLGCARAQPTRTENR